MIWAGKYRKAIYMLFCAMALLTIAISFGRISADRSYSFWDISDSPSHPLSSPLSSCRIFGAKFYGYEIPTELWVMYYVNGRLVDRGNDKIEVCGFKINLSKSPQLTDRIINGNYPYLEIRREIVDHFFVKYDSISVRYDFNNSMLRYGYALSYYVIGRKRFERFCFPCIARQDPTVGGVVDTGFLMYLLLDMPNDSAYP